MNDIRLDSHKLIFHPDIVSKWKNGEMIYPLEMEVGLSGGCNHRCIFCAVDYIGYEPSFLDGEVIIKNLRKMSRRGLKSVIYSGEGEPLLHKNASSIFNATKSCGIDVALATNGVLLTPEFATECLAAFSWIRFSIAGATDCVYEKVQQSPKGDFQRVLNNLQGIVRLKKDMGLKTTLGAQLILLPDNKDEVVLLAGILKRIGLDYFTIKPFSQHPQSKVTLQIDYSEATDIERELQEYVGDDFKIYFRKNSIKNLENEKPYDQCHGLNFMVHVDAHGDVFPCIAFVGNKKFSYGNIYKQSLIELWESDRVRKMIQGFSGDFLGENCRKACRLDEMNKYLYELKHPNSHVNFI